MMASTKDSSYRSLLTAKMRLIKLKATMETVTTWIMDHSGLARHSCACAQVKVLILKPRRAESATSSQELGTFATKQRSYISQGKDKA